MSESRLSQYQFNLFKGGIDRKYPAGIISLADAIALIRGDTYAIQIADLRGMLATSGKKAAEPIKKKLDYVTFSGTFKPTRLEKNLQQHSGLTVLDFDHVTNLRETRLQLQSDPHTLVLFCSPSGDGLKLVVEIDPAKHRDTYTDLVFYFRQQYALEQKVDATSIDPSRACFLSHDPDVFVNVNAERYESRGLAIAEQQRAKKPLTEFQMAKNATDVYKHVLAVVERIETAQVDISGGPGEYDSRLLLAFCMSTLGEDGRPLLHRILQFYPNYTVEETDAKFDQGRDKSRFTTPWKFFDIAKQYGIDVSKPGGKKKVKASVERISREQQTDAEPTKAEIKAKAHAVGVLMDAVLGPGHSKQGAKSKDPQAAPGAKTVYNWDTNGTVTYDKDKNEIRVKSGKSGHNTIADNFLLYIKYVAEDENENLTWILEIQPFDGPSVFVEVSHDDFNSASKLKRVISGKQYALKISDSELSELHGYLFARTKFSRAAKIIRYGYDAPSGVFFFANKAINVAQPGPVLLPDDFGMVQVQKEGRPVYLSMPANNKHKANRFSLTDQQLTINQFFQIYAQAHGYENALIPFCFYLMSLYRDLALKHKNFSPILFLKGGFGTGKSSMIRVLTAAFGRKQEGVNLKAKNTESALSKLMSQASNTIIWFDEYHNEITCEGLLQAAYDNDGYHITKSGTVGTNETGSIDIYSALALTSNYIPENDIFFSRCVFIPIPTPDKTPAQVVAFNQLEEWQEAGLGCLTVELLQHRDFVEKEYGFAFDLLLKRFRDEFKGERIPERFFTNMAQLMTVGVILCSEAYIDMTEFTDVDEIVDEFVRVGAHCIRRQHRIMAEKTALTEFFEIIQQLYDQYQIHEEIHFDFKILGGVCTVRLWFPQLYNLYAQYYRRINQKAPADRDTLQSEIAAFEDQPDWDAVKKQIRFVNDGESNSQASTMPRPNSCTMNYSKLQDKFGLNLESRKPKN